MGVIRIELSAPVQGGPCSCCGRKTTRLTRFVYSDGDAFAIYYATFTDNHPDRTVRLAISLGEWGEGGGPENRVSFAVLIRSSASEYQVTVIDAAGSPWREVANIGRMLDRKEALVHPWIEDVFHITDHIVVDDPMVKTYLDETKTA